MLDAAQKLPTEEPQFIEQRWNEYTNEQHDVWALLYERRMRDLAEHGSEVYLRGAERIGLCPDCVPDLRVVNEKLRVLTGWQAVPVSGFLPAPEFFRCLSRRLFPTTVTIRPREQLDYLPEPDIFHDVFGHVPLHASPAFADYLQRFGQIACRAEREEQIAGMARLFWFTVEFGLVREDDAGEGVRERAHLVARRRGARAGPGVRAPAVQCGRGAGAAVRDRPDAGRAVRGGHLRAALPRGAGGGGQVGDSGRRVSVASWAGEDDHGQ